jgi:hypothetical protein
MDVFIVTFGIISMFSGILHTFLLCYYIEIKKNSKLSMFEYIVLFPALYLKNFGELAFVFYVSKDFSNTNTQELLRKLINTNVLVFVSFFLFALVAIFFE